LPSAFIARPPHLQDPPQSIQRGERDGLADIEDHDGIQGDEPALVPVRSEPLRCLPQRPERRSVGERVSLSLSTGKLFYFARAANGGQEGK